jgi:hypothetical protein
MRDFGVTSGLGRAALGVAFALATSIAHSAGAAADTPPGVRGAAGLWEMTLNDTNRKCRLVLRADPAPTKAFALAMPAGCRRALPILASVDSWTVAPKALALIDDSGTPVLQFNSEKDAQTLIATGPEGETYNLIAANPGPHVELTTVAQAASTTPATTATSAAPSTPTAADIPGRYDIMRAGGKDTSCMLTLDGKAKGPKGGKKAALAPACRDQGIVIFDPAGWRLEKGRLTLTAKKGHETHLDLQADGTWAKDPKEGAALILKKM